MYYHCKLGLSVFQYISIHLAFIKYLLFTNIA